MMKYLQVKLDNDTHKCFKRKCLEKEIDMSSLIRQFIEKFLHKGE